ncbi:MAG: hypothetical protein WAT39_19455, partial [Planctomycetota bacterium]
MTRTLHPRSRRSWLAFAICGALAACGSGGTENGGVGGPGDPGGPSGGDPPGDPPGDPGSGGGPGGPGGAGNPLAIVLDFSVANEGTVERTETLCTSIPFPEGGYAPSTLATMVVSGHQTAWLPLQYWADGTVKVAQAQFTDTLAAGQVKNYVIAKDEPSLAGAFTRNPWVAQLWNGLEIGAEVRDTFSVPYRAFATGGSVVQTSPLVQTTRHHSYHLPLAGQTGIGRDYLTSTFYVTEYRDMPFVVVDWIVGNDYLGADVIPPGNTDRNLRALGTVDVRGAWFLTKGTSAMMPYRFGPEGLSPFEVLNGGYGAFRVMTDTFLADAQTRRYRFLLRCEPPGAASAEVARWQATSTAMLANPMYPLATQAAWVRTRA